jgi:hypothetical protein
MVDDRELGSKALGPELQARVQQMHLEHNLGVSGKMRVLEQLLREWHDENFKERCFLLSCFYF